jgi:hypothetical protein
VFAIALLVVLLIAVVAGIIWAIVGLTRGDKDDE